MALKIDLLVLPFMEKPYALWYRALNISMKMTGNRQIIERKRRIGWNK
jgi:hypothetical protein